MAEKKPAPAKPKKTHAAEGSQRKTISNTDTHPPEVVAEVGMLVRAGLLKTPEITRRTGVTGATIQRWKKKYGWEPDLKDRVRREAARKAIVGDLIDEDQAVEEAVEETLQVLGKHKTLLARNVELIEMMQNRMMPRGPAGAAALASAPIDEEEKIDLGQLAMVGRAVVDMTSKTIADMRRTYNMDSEQGVATFDEMVDEAERLNGQKP